jgi:hypothetical protein
MAKWGIRRRKHPSYQGFLYAVRHVAKAKDWRINWRAGTARCFSDWSHEMLGVTEQKGLWHGVAVGEATVRQYADLQWAKRRGATECLILRQDPLVAIAPPAKLTLTETAGPPTIKATHAVWAIPRCRIAQKRTRCPAVIPPIPPVPVMVAPWTLLCPPEAASAHVLRSSTGVRGPPTGLRHRTRECQ